MINRFIYIQETRTDLDQVENLIVTPKKKLEIIPSVDPHLSIGPFLFRCLW